MRDARRLDFLSSLSLAGNQYNTSPLFGAVRCSQIFHGTIYTAGAGPSPLPPPPPTPPVPPPPPPPQVAHTGDKEKRTINSVARARESWVFIAVHLSLGSADVSRRVYNTTVFQETVGILFGQWPIIVVFLHNYYSV